MDSTNDPRSQGMPAGLSGAMHAVSPIRDYAGVVCQQELEVVVHQFMSFGRLAHFRRALLALPHVASARIAHYAGRTAVFALTVAPGTAAGAMQVAGTQLVSCDGRRLELCVETRW